MPINVVSNHWFLAVLDLKTWKVIVYDSRTRSNYFNLYKQDGQFKSMGESILSELDSISYWAHFPSGHRPSVVEFVEADNPPQQQLKTSRGDCGVFVCMFMEMLASGVPVAIDTDSREMAFRYRNRMLEIIWETVR